MRRDAAAFHETFHQIGSTYAGYSDDGDGKLASEWSQTTVYGYPDTATSYVVRSTVIGEVLTRLDQSGNKTITHVPAEGLLFATQETSSGLGPFIRWTQRNPLGITETGKGVYDPLGNYIPFQQHNDPRPPAGSYSSASMSGLSASTSNANDYGMGCFVDGVPMNCNRAMAYVNTGVVQVRSIVSGNGNGMATQLGLTSEQRYVRVDGELRLGAYRWFLRNLAPGGQPSVESNPQKTIEKPFSSSDLKAIKGRLQKMTTKECQDFINKLLTTAGEGGDPPVTTNILDLFDMVASQRGFFSATSIRDGRGFSTVDGAVGAPNGAKVLLSSTSDLYSPQTRILYHAFNALSELTHVAGHQPSSYAEGTFSDANLGRVAYDVARQMGYSTSAPPNIDPHNDPFGRWSGYYHRIVQHFCKRD